MRRKVIMSPPGYCNQYASNIARPRCHTRSCYHSETWRQHRFNKFASSIELSDRPVAQIAGVVDGRSSFRHRGLQKAENNPNEKDVTTTELPLFHGWAEPWPPCIRASAPQAATLEKSAQGTATPATSTSATRPKPSRPLTGQASPFAIMNNLGP